MAEHLIIVSGVWHNDSTAGVEVYCGTCDQVVLDGEEFGDRLTPAQIAEAVAKHSDQVLAGG